MKDGSKDRAFGRLLVTFVGAVAVAPGCGTEPGGTDIHQTRGEITGGSLLKNNVAPFSAAVKIGGCTATKIGPRRFLTAGHCFAAVFATANIGFRISIDNTLAGATPTPYIGVNKLYIHPTFDPNAENVTYDAAVVDVTSDTPLIPTVGIDTAGVPDGEALTMVGYGCDKVAPSHDGKKQTVQLSTMTLAELQAVDIANVSFNPRVYSHYYAMNGGDAVAAPGGCPVDSGGPFFRFINGVARVAGIDALMGAGAATDPPSRLTFATHVDDIASWINSAAPSVRQKSGAIIDVTKGTCLSVGVGTTVGSPVVEEPCGPATTTNNPQYWFITNFGQANQYLIQNGKTGLCLSTASTGLTQQGLCPNFGWLIPQLGFATTITSQQTGLLLGSNGGAGVDTATAESNSRQKWLVIR